MLDLYKLYSWIWNTATHIFVNQSTTTTRGGSLCGIMGMPSHSTGKWMSGE